LQYSEKLKKGALNQGKFRSLLETEEYATSNDLHVLAEQ
jgi:hypothetical protein